MILAGFALATIGYFDYSYRLPRTTWILTVSGLLVLTPAWFLTIRRRPVGSERAIIIGDDPDEIRDVLEATDMPVVGYVSPPSPYYLRTETEFDSPVAGDGSGDAVLDDLDCLGGLSRLDDVLVEYDVDTAMLSFARPNRAEFLGALDTCYEHGVRAKVHRDHTEDVLTFPPVGMRTSLTWIGSRGTGRTTPSSERSTLSFPSSGGWLSHLSSR